MINFTSGDILQSQEQYIAQGVAEGNQEGLGTELALKISRKFPLVQSSFKKFARRGTFKGGSIWVYSAQEKQPGFIYLATQPNMYFAKLSYLRKALRNLAKWADANSIQNVALPKIGAGLGKLSWEDEVKPLLIELLSESKTEFIIYEQFTLKDEINS